MAIVTTPDRHTPQANAQPICIPIPPVSCPPPPPGPPTGPQGPNDIPPVPTPPAFPTNSPAPGPGSGPGALTPPNPGPGNGTPIVPVPGDTPPAAPGNPPRVPPAPANPPPGQPEPPPPPPPAEPGAPSGDIVSQLEHAAQLHDQGVLSDDEFNALKQRLLHGGEQNPASTSGDGGVIPPELIHPASCGVPGIRVLSPAEVHEVVTSIVGPLEEELGPDDPFVRRIIDRTNQLNKGCAGTKDQIKQIVWQEVRDEWYRVYRERNRTRDRSKKECAYKGDTSKDCEGLVAVCLAKGQENLPEPQKSNVTRQRDAYITGGNAYIASNMFPAWRIATTDTPERGIASQLATQWKEAHPEIFRNPDPAQFPSGKAEPGHVPDTMWTGPPPPKPMPYAWEAMDSSLNRSIGAQGRQYPINYKARAFVPGDWEDGVCVPSANPRVMASPPPTSF
ncbi:SHOCT domain-containing protein [Nocardia sp. NPDC051570]|uniref:SHOCT domain-containing protein n=1 Tax=Nocardia sp. NPDC051570 TaxID=3364324 RepID=UPI0037A05D70